MPMYSVPGLMFSPPYGDGTFIAKMFYDAMRFSPPDGDGTSTKKFLKSSAVAIPRIKQQCRNVIGYGVEVKIIDL